MLALAGAARDQLAREQALIEERVAIARAVAAAVEGFVDADIAALRAMATLPGVRAYERVEGATLDRVMLPIFEAFQDLETVGLIGADGWNVRSLTRHVPTPPRTINVADRPYFREAMSSGRLVVSPAVSSRLRPGVPVVAIAVPVSATDDAPEPGTRGVLVGTVALGQLRERIEHALPNQRLAVILVDSDGQVILAPEVDPTATRPLTLLRGNPAVDAALAGEDGSRHLTGGPAGEELLVSYAPVPDIGWGVLVQQPAAAALEAARLEAARSLGLLLLALALSLVLAWILSSRLARSFLELEAARGEAERSLQARDAFLAAVSHDLKNPLAAIKLQTQLLERQARGDASPQAERAAAAAAGIERRADRMQALINELVDVAHLQVGQPLALERGPTDLVALAGQALAEQRQLATPHDLELEAGEPQLVGSWDAGRLARVLDNLVSNAVKYSPGGEIVVSVTRDGDWAILSVRDQGVGIPAADLPHLSEPFYRGQNERRAVGTGLGLWGARQIVEQHGGTLEVTSREGVGTTVTVRLPLAGAPEGIVEPATG